MSDPVTLPKIIQDALDRAVDDESVLFDDSILDEAARLSMTNQRLFQRLLVEARELGVRIGDLKREITKRVKAAEPAKGAAEPSGTPSLGELFKWRPNTGLFQRVETARAVSFVRLTNFTAQIVSETILDDDVELRRQYDIEALVRGETLTTRVPASEYATMAWVTQLGAGAIIMPGPGTRDGARAAIQAYSLKRRVRRAYTHTGWRRLPDGAWAYLHALGAVVADVVADPTGPAAASTNAAAAATSPTAGQATATSTTAASTAASAESNGAAPALPVSSETERRTPPPKPEPRVVVDLPQQLSRVELPEPPVGDARRASIRAVLRMIRLCPRLLYPLVAFAFRAVLSPVDFAIWMLGPTGCWKSEIATLIQQLWGRRWSRRHLALSWTSTATAIESILFAGKDSVVVLDDFVPGGSASDRDRLYALAERVLRSLGNGSARARGTASGGLRPDHPPRASVVVTAEERPRGHSAQARCLIVELAHGEFTSASLSACQAEGSSGAYALAMAAYIHWIGQRLVAGTAPRVAERARELRDTATSSEMHRRTPGIAGDLGVGLEEFLAYATEAGAVTAAERGTLWAEGWAAIGAAAAAQGDHHVEEEPAARFLRLLGSAVATGRAHFTSTSGGEPANSGRWGWRPAQVGKEEIMRAGGDQIGWVTLGGAEILLDPDAAFRVAQSYSLDQGIAVSAGTLRKRMHERGLLASVEKRGGKVHLLVRRTLSGARREVLHVKWPQAPEDPDPITGVDETQADNDFENTTQGDLFAEGGPSA